MKKSEILKSIKIALLSFVLLIGVGTVFADEWTAPPCGAPDCNTATPINIDRNTQTKEGDLALSGANGWLFADRINSLSSSYFFDEVRIGEAGVAGNPELHVLGDVTFYDLSVNNTDDNSDMTYPSKVCTSNTGNITACEPLLGAEVEEPEFTIQDQVIVVDSSTEHGSNLTATCPGDHPYVIGGGGFCPGDYCGGGAGGGFCDVGDSQITMKSIPIKNGGSTFYNAWQYDCGSESDDIYVYAICAQ